MGIEGWKYRLTMEDGNTCPENLFSHHWQTIMVRLAENSSILPTWCHITKYLHFTNINLNESNA